ncbi:MAG: aconitase X [Promethearchaeota archaeon]
MRLNQEEKEMLEGKYGKSTQKAMEILATLGEIFDAENMIDVHGVQIAGVSYANRSNSRCFIC